MLFNIFVAWADTLTPALSPQEAGNEDILLLLVDDEAFAFTFTFTLEGAESPPHDVLVLVVTGSLHELGT
jgi:hypothetical protein